MHRVLIGLSLALMVVASAPNRVGAQGAEGIWKVSYVTFGVNENTAAIVKINVQDGKTTGEMIVGSPRLKEITLKSVTQVGPTLRIVLQVGTAELNFETDVPKQAAKRLPGSMSINGTFYPGVLTATEELTLDAKSSARLVDCAPMQQARTLSLRSNTLRFQAQKSKDAEKKKELLKEAAEADAAAKKETPGLYREVLEKHADSPAVFEAALNLIRAAKTSDAKADDVKSWASAGAKSAKAYGARFEGDFAGQIATALLGQDGMEKLAVTYARQAEKSRTPQASASDQVRVLGLLARALKKAGMGDEVKMLEARVAKLDEILDREYTAKMPGFKGVAFEGRRTKSERAVFMELFTGATCPPCVAADLAFDVLQKTYKPSELVLLQYHMHIPGPDPMTNADTEARWKYYTKKFPMQVRGVPSSIFNGQPKASGGGGAANAEKKYGAYREVINPLLEDNAGAKIAVQARRNGERIEIFVKVSDVNDPDANKKLRIALTEETVRYPGSNKIRLHHNVVRAFPGGVEGVALTEAASRHKASVNLGELRGGLTKYLDNFEATVRPFANPARPMSLEHLRVVAFVQDDNSREILQAIQVPVEAR